MMKVEGGAGVSLASIEGILLQLLAPFVAGHLLRPWIGGFVSRHKSLLTLVDRGSILLSPSIPHSVRRWSKGYGRACTGDLGRHVPALPCCCSG